MGALFLNGEACGGAGGDAKVPSMTYAEYLTKISQYQDKLVDITDIDGIATADAIFYDNTNSGLSAVNVQDAIDEIKDSAGKIISTKDAGLAWIKWTNILCSKDSEIDEVAKELSRFNIVCLQSCNLNGYVDDINPITAQTREVILKAKKFNKNLRVFQYIQSESARTDFPINADDGSTLQYAYLNADGTWEGSTASKAINSSGVHCTKIYNIDDIKAFLDYFSQDGITDGIFFDDWGYDWQINHICYQMKYDTSDYSLFTEALNQKWIDLIELTHSYGLNLITNGGFNNSVGSWYTHLTNDDIICFESAVISSHSQPQWGNFNSIYNYRKNFFEPGLCDAKTWALNYIYPSLNDEAEALSAVLSFCIGCDYVSYGIGNYINNPFYLDIIKENDYEISKLDDYSYRLKTKNHILEIILSKYLVGGKVIVDSDILDTLLLYDNKPFKVENIKAEYVDYKLSKEVDTLQAEIDEISGDSSGVKLWKTTVDDWFSTPNKLSNFTNLSHDYPFDAKGTGISYTGTPDDFTAVAASSGWGNAVGFFDININKDNEDLIGKTIEFGSLVYENTLTNPYISLKTIINGNTNYVKLTNQKSSILSDNTNGFSYKYTIPQGCTKIQTQWLDSWISTTPACTLHVASPYIIDVNEYADLPKTWYTNLYSGDYGYASAMKTTVKKSTYGGKPTYDVTFTSTDPWGWAVHEFTSEEIIALRGHTIEFGMNFMQYSTEGFTGASYNGTSANCIFSVDFNQSSRVPGRNRITTDTKTLSRVWNKEQPCIILSIPNDCTQLCVGYKSNGVPAGEVLTAKNVYLYDLNEENIKKRGEESLSALKVCRVNEEIESSIPSKVKNSVYLTDKGHMYSYDLMGNKIDIANYDNVIDNIRPKAVLHSGNQTTGTTYYDMVNNGIYLVIVRSWVAVNSGHSMAIVSNITKNYQTVTSLVKDSYGVTITTEDNKIKIEDSGYGYVYSILQLN